MSSDSATSSDGGGVAEVGSNGEGRGSGESGAASPASPRSVSDSPQPSVIRANSLSGTVLIPPTLENGSPQTSGGRKKQRRLTRSEMATAISEQIFNERSDLFEGERLHALRGIKRDLSSGMRGASRRNLDITTRVSSVSERPPEVEEKSDSGNTDDAVAPPDETAERDLMMGGDGEDEDAGAEDANASATESGGSGNNKPDSEKETDPDPTPAANAQATTTTAETEQGVDATARDASGGSSSETEERDTSAIYDDDDEFVGDTLDDLVDSWVRLYDYRSGSFYWLNMDNGSYTNTGAPPAEGCDDDVNTSMMGKSTEELLAILTIQIAFRKYKYQCLKREQRRVVLSAVEEFDQLQQDNDQQYADAGEDEGATETQETRNIMRSALANASRFARNQRTKGPDPIVSGLIEAMRKSRHLCVSAPEQLPASSFSDVQVTTYGANRFKEYAPRVFYKLRTMFGVSSQTFQKSLGADDLSVMEQNAGRSGSYFFISKDKKFLLKTINNAENVLLRQILESYYNHCKQHPNTLLTRYLGLYALRVPGKKVRFLAMSNVFENGMPQEAYDLKGSTVNRSVLQTEDDRESLAGKILKDNDLDKEVHLDRRLRLILIMQLEHDTEWLLQHDIMDYSLLLGIRYRSRTAAEAQARSPNAARSRSVVMQTNPLARTSNSSATGQTEEDERKDTVGELPAETNSPMRLVPLPRTTSKLSRMQHETKRRDSAIAKTSSSSAGNGNAGPRRRWFGGLFRRGSSTEAAPSSAAEQSGEGAGAAGDESAPEGAIRNGRAANGQPPKKRKSILDRLMRRPGSSGDDRDSVVSADGSPSITFRESALQVGVSLFQQHDGGILGYNSDSTARDEVYYFGLIDLLQNYNLQKQMERGIKVVRGQKREGISSMQSSDYRDRFLTFMRKILVDY